MKLSKIRIKNMFGISLVELNQSSVELTGANKTCKTSIIDAIRYGLENKSPRDYTIRNGETEAEILIETDTGISINRKVRDGQADYKSIKQGGKEIPQPESFLRDLFVPIQLNPVDFLNMTKNEQNRAILNLIKFDWDLNWIKTQFGEIPMGVNYEQNILCVLSDIQSEKGSYFQTRQEKNRQIKEKRAVIAEINETLPEGYDIAKWESAKLGEFFTALEKSRAKNAMIEKAQIIIENADDKNRKIDADYEIEIAAIDRTSAAEKTRIEADIAKLNAEIALKQKDLDAIAEKNASAKKIAEAKKAEAIAKTCADIDEARKLANEPKEDVSIIEEKANNAERMKAHLGDAKKILDLSAEIEDLAKKALEFTEKIELARTLPQEILKTAKIPVEGLTVEDGIPLIGGLPVNNLCDGEKLDLCVDIAGNNKSAMQIILIDGAERLAVEMRTALYEKCKARGIQFIAARTTDDKELTITEL